jgi:lysophospholipase L1-like esterase
MGFSYLALGDSYTIGEMVLLHENFPTQTVQLLVVEGISLQAPRIIAKTGWTTDELDAAIHSASINEKYDFVSLLIGVNNQYRGRSVSEYKIQFNDLLSKAILFSGNRPERVFVLSIPDWGITPFAVERNRASIAKEIDTFNAAAQECCIQRHVAFIDITIAQRVDGSDPAFLAQDQLHPSGKEYTKWAVQLANAIKKVLQHESN